MWMLEKGPQETSYKNTRSIEMDFNENDEDTNESTRMNSARESRFTVTTSYYNKPLRTPILPKSVPNLIDSAARDFPNKEAYTFKYQTRSAETITFRELKKECDQLASAFIELGMEAGEKVAICGDNCLDWLLCDFAAMKAGLVTIRIGPNIDTELLAIIIQHFSVKMLIFYPGDNNEYFHRLQSNFPTFFKEKAGTLEHERPQSLQHVIMMIRGRTQSSTTLGHLLTATFNQRKVMARQQYIEPDEVATIFISPGPNQSIKCVGHNHYTLVNELTTAFMLFNPTREDKVLVGTPISSRSCDFFMPIICQVHLIAIRGYKISGDIGTKFALRVIEREEINSICYSPALLEEFIIYLKDNDQKDIFLHWGRVVGDIPQEIFKLALNYIPGLIVVYGKLENLAIAQTSMHDYTDKKLEFTGVPTPGTELKIVGDGNRINALNEIGEVWVRCIYNYQVVKGIDPELLKQKRPSKSDFKRSEIPAMQLMELNNIDENGWLRTGDVGFMTGDGHIRVMGPQTDMIERGDKKYYAKSLEEVLQKHPDVESSVVVGVPDKLFGKKICAFVKPMRGAEVKNDKIKVFVEQRGLFVDYILVNEDYTSSENPDKDKLVTIALEKLEL